jgi:mycofactocin system creatininase family protein
MPRILHEFNSCTTPSRASGLLIVPVGSMEQHGPHLPLDTDTRIAVAVASRAAERYPSATLGPAIAYGASGEHAGFPGTISIGTPALAQLLLELGRDASRDWDRVLFVNGHGGNADAFADAIGTLADEGRSCLVFHVAPPGGDAHAGRAETSMLLHIAPEAVRLALAAPGETRPIGQIIGRLRAEGVRAVSPTGVLGDPRGATAAEGRALLDGETDRCLDLLDRVAAAHG